MLEINLIGRKAFVTTALDSKGIAHYTAIPLPEE